MALINCPECGKEVSDKAYTCPHCGNPMSIPSDTDTVQSNGAEEFIFCPRCLSMQVHSEKKGFGGGKALAGAIAFGGIGILAGTIGSKKVDVTCLKCGHKFKAGDSLVATINEKNKIEQDLNNEIRLHGTRSAQQYIQKKQNWGSSQAFCFIETYMKGHPDVTPAAVPNDDKDAIYKIGCLIATVIIIAILFWIFI